MSAPACDSGGVHPVPDTIPGLIPGLVPGLVPDLVPDRALVDDHPGVVCGLVTAWSIRPWRVVVGEGAR